ncbi:MAG: glycosyltransferase family 4 protein [Proteobacteria bacterium]|nr:glycosyltransferase family 4 protein [Pseudomonadota bacterium]
MKIGILVAGLPPEVLGGAETQAMRAAARLAERHEVTMFTRSATVPESLRNRPRCLVVRRCTARRRGLRFVADLLGSLRALAARRHALDVLVAYQSVIDGLIAVIAGRWWSLPTLVWIRSEVEFDFVGSRQARWLAPWVYRRADRIAVQTARLGEQLQVALRSAGHARLADSVAAKSCVIGNGIELAAPSAASDRTELLYVGRLAADKGVIHLLEAMRCCPGARLTIVGDGPERERLQAAARGIAHIQFAGRTPPEQVPAWLAQAGIVVLPSLRNEGLPNVLLEAMAAGLVVIASRNAGIPDLVRDGENGLLVEPGDSRALAQGDPCGECRRRVARPTASTRAQRCAGLCLAGDHRRPRKPSRRVDTPGGRRVNVSGGRARDHHQAMEHHAQDRQLAEPSSPLHRQWC